MEGIQAFKYMAETNGPRFNSASSKSDSDSSIYCSVSLNFRSKGRSMSISDPRMSWAPCGSFPDRKQMTDEIGNTKHHADRRIPAKRHYNMIKV